MPASTTTGQCDVSLLYTLITIERLAPTPIRINPGESSLMNPGLACHGDDALCHRTAGRQIVRVCRLATNAWRFNVFFCCAERLVRQRARSNYFSDLVREVMVALSSGGICNQCPIPTRRWNEKSGRFKVTVAAFPISGQYRFCMASQ